MGSLILLSSGLCNHFDNDHLTVLQSSKHTDSLVNLMLYFNYCNQKSLANCIFNMNSCNFEIMFSFLDNFNFRIV